MLCLMGPGDVVPPGGETRVMVRIDWLRVISSSIAATSVSSSVACVVPTGHAIPPL